MLSNIFDLDGLPLVSETFEVLLKVSNIENKFTKNIITNSFPSLKYGDIINNVYKDVKY